MTIARAHLVDVSVTRWYHCVTRCVRPAFLLGEGPFDRKEQIDRRLQELAEIFAVAVGGFSVLDNHLHLLLRLDPDTAKGWSDEEVVRQDAHIRSGVESASDRSVRNRRSWLTGDLGWTQLTIRGKSRFRGWVLRKIDVELQPVSHDLAPDFR